MVSYSDRRKTEDLRVIKITCPECSECGKASVMQVNEKAFLDWKSGLMPIQVAFPNMTIDDREVLMTGTHPKCWDKMFGDFDDD